MWTWCGAPVTVSRGYRGGPLFHADTIGLEIIHDGILKYRDLFGPMHWQPAPLLARLVSEGVRLSSGMPRANLE